MHKGKEIKSTPIQKRENKRRERYEKNPVITAEKEFTIILQLKFVIKKIEDVKLKMSENDPRKREKYSNKFEPFL